MKNYIQADAQTPPPPRHYIFTDPAFNLHRPHVPSLLLVHTYICIFRFIAFFKMQFKMSPTPNRIEVAYLAGESAKNS